MQYSMASGAFEILPGGAPSVKISSSDLAVYQKYLRATSQVHVGQSLPGQLPSSSISGGYDVMKTYRISSRSQYSYLDTDATSRWGYSLVEGLRLANRQGHAQQLRNMLLYGVEAANNEGIVNSPNATTLNLGNDSKGNDAYTTWDSGELAKFMLGLIADQKNSHDVVRTVIDHCCVMSSALHEGVGMDGCCGVNELSAYWCRYSYCGNDGERHCQGRQWR
ncbi:hypothetical protein [Yersinia kristensenii]|uniref:hypothetical protein n=1 Tax=Yersinia kristensenii TaxID=28152 RepID=UPI00200A1B70|nr:hypothetical protein [Yersinia kristensenii]